MSRQSLLGINKVPKYTGPLDNLKQFSNVLSRLDESNGPTVAIGLVSLAALLALQHWKRNVYKAATASRVQSWLKLVADLSGLLMTVIGGVWAWGYEHSGVAVCSSRFVDRRDVGCDDQKPSA